MSKALRLLVFGLFLIVFPATGMAASPAYKLRVDGLACPFCAYGVEKKLSAIKDVKASAMDIMSGTVTVTMTDNATLDEATIILLLTLMAQQRVGNRPSRIEPRAFTRRPPAYSMLMKPRAEAREIVSKNGHPKKLK